jgi:hypothetical protein
MWHQIMILKWVHILNKIIPYLNHDIYNGASYIHSDQLKVLKYIYVITIITIMSLKNKCFPV